MIYKYVSESKYEPILPKNATNGDVIKAMFPTAKFYCAERLQTAGMPRRNADFDVDWWNAPYKAESEVKG